MLYSSAEIVSVKSPSNAVGMGESFDGDASVVPGANRSDARVTFQNTAGPPRFILGWIAPHMQTLALESVSFQGLPKLLLSTTHLVDLRLGCIPHFGYVLPEVMATCLSTMTDRLRPSKNIFRRVVYRDPSRR